MQNRRIALASTGLIDRYERTRDDQGTGRGALLSQHFQRALVAPRAHFGFEGIGSSDSENRCVLISMMYLKLTYTLERTHLTKTCEAIEMNKLNFNERFRVLELRREHS